MKIELPKIYAIVNVENIDSSLALVKKILEAKLGIIQIRCKLGLQVTKTFTNETLELRNAIMPSTKIIVNDFPEVASSCSADGVHLGQEDGDPISARKLLGEESIIGLSCHSLNDLKKAPISSLSYLAFGPIFPTTSKINHSPIVGLDLLKEFVDKSPLPVVAIGGINKENISLVFEGGASSCAMIGGLEAAISALVVKT